jgi:hypothetical protein
MTASGLVARVAVSKLPVQSDRHSTDRHDGKACDNYQRDDQGGSLGVEGKGPAGRIRRCQ